MKKIYLTISITENGKKYAFAETIKTGENLLPHVRRHKNADIMHLCESRREAEERAIQWNAIYKANNEFLFDTPAF